MWSMFIQMRFIDIVGVPVPDGPSHMHGPFGIGLPPQRARGLRHRVCLLYLRLRREFWASGMRSYRRMGVAVARIVKLRLRVVICALT